MSQPCGCCAGIQILTPETEANPPGLGALSYRVGTYATFYATMLARLSTVSIQIPATDGSGSIQTIYPLSKLTTREPSDPSIALLDAWAVVADVLTFYQERIANEGYLPTATERCSLLQLARLVNYTLRPGVSASVWLAFTVQTGFSGTIPAGTRAQSIPASGQMPQFFETSADLDVSDQWNDLQVQLTRPQSITAGDLLNAAPNSLHTVYLKGIATNLQVGNGVILTVGGASSAVGLRVVAAVTPQASQQQTKVSLSAVAASAWPATQAAVKDAPLAAGLPEAGTASTTAGAITKEDNSLLGKLTAVIPKLAAPPNVQPPSSIRLARTVTQAFNAQSDLLPRLLLTFNPAVSATLYPALEGITPLPSGINVYAARVKAALFANNFAGAPVVSTTPSDNSASSTTTTSFTPPTLGEALSNLILLDANRRPTGLSGLPLDAVYDQITVGSMVAITRPCIEPETGPVTTFHEIVSVGTASRETENAAGSYTGYTAKVTQLSLSPQWLSDLATSPDTSADAAEEFRRLSPLQRALGKTDLLRGTVIYAQAEGLAPAEEPIGSSVEGTTINLDGVYNGLESGRWIIVSGERTDIANTTGVTASELVMISGVSQETASDNTAYTVLTLANNGLAYTYDRSSVTIYGNVAEATNGQSVGQVLGNGNASQAFQTFTLGQQPLTYVSAATPSGAQSTLSVTVNQIEWEETDDLSALGPNDHAYITQTNNSGQTSVVFGNGVNGARVPTGTANVQATYRYGIGSAGNVVAQQVSQMATQPGGVQSVINPLPASGGADPDTVNQARANTPLAVNALDRLVPVQDYAEFSLTYAGIGKAASVKLSNGRRQVVFVTIAGAEDIPIDTNSDLYNNLVQSLQQFGDPHQPLLVGVRQRKLLVISAGFQVQAGYQFEDVEPNVRAALLNTFGFDNRSLGQTAFLSEAVSAMQGVQGVAFVNVTVFDSVSQTASATTLGSLSTNLVLRAYILARPAYVDTSLSLPQNPTAQDYFQIQPAELVYLTPDIADTLILTEITPAQAGPVPVLPTRRKTTRVTRGGKK